MTTATKSAEADDAAASSFETQRVQTSLRVARSSQIKVRVESKNSEGTKENVVEFRIAPQGVCVCVSVS